LDTGIGFNLGFIENNNKLEYRFGFLFKKTGRFHKLLDTPLKKSDFVDLKSNPNISFKATFGENEYNFQILRSKNTLAQNLIINNVEGMFKNI
jgi:hypothetical protein